MSCFVPGCESRNNKKNTPHLFRFPKHGSEDTRRKWIFNIPNREGKVFDFQKNQLCHLHFVEKFIVKSTEVRMGDMVMVSQARKRWTLTNDAFPTLFLNAIVPKCSDRKVNVRKPPRTRPPIKAGQEDKENVPPKKVVNTFEKARESSSSSLEDTVPPEPLNKLQFGSNASIRTTPRTQPPMKVRQEEKENVPPQKVFNTFMKARESSSSSLEDIFEEPVNIRKPLAGTISPLKMRQEEKKTVPPQEVVNTQQSSSFSLVDFIPPEPWNKLRFGSKLRFERLLQYWNPAPMYFSERSVEVEGDDIAIFIRHSNIQKKSKQDVTSAEDFTKLLLSINEMKICRGVSMSRSFIDDRLSGAFKFQDRWISLKCKITSVDDEACAECRDFLQRPSRKRKLIKAEEDAIHLRKKVKLAQQTVRRKSEKITTLSEHVNDLQRKLDAADFTNLESIISKQTNLSPAFKRSLIVAANLAKAKSKYGMRYQADWILQSILIKIQSPKNYRYLRDNEILPLPHPKYLTSILRGIDCNFGFSKVVMNQLKKEMENKPQQDRQYMLVYDEMKIRESIAFDKSDMRFHGFIDYAEFASDYKPRSSKREADHALVFMCRSFNSGLTQPIGCFATRGAAPGSILAKMILSAICQLEDAGCEVVGVVSDGAPTNKSAWKALGISGKGSSVVNKIENPADSTRFVHFLCDMPHMVKCIRNHMHTHKIVKYENHEVSWHSLVSLFNEESKRDLKAAPKITYAHINPNPFQKMRVPLAVQIVSKTVADALQFYREKCKLRAFKNSEHTEYLLRKLNTLFDACNARRPHEGITVNSPMYNVIQEFLNTINDRDTFASTVTKESLRVSLQSHLDIIDYLCNVVGFAYVLTAKMNQDCIEKFFGLLRSFGGDENHPTVESFSHLYRLMSIYCPSARVIRGNINSDEDLCVVSYMDSLKSLKRERESEAKEARLDLEEAILERIICNPDSVEGLSMSNESANPDRCISYYLCGFVAFKAKTMTDCEKCLASLQDNDYTGSDASLLVVKDLGKLKRPSNALFNLIFTELEPQLKLRLEQGNFSHSFVSDFVNSFTSINAAGVGCGDDHSTSFVPRIIIYYVTIRLYFYAKNYSRALKSSSVTKRKMKEAKLS